MKYARLGFTFWMMSFDPILYDVSIAYNNNKQIYLQPHRVGFTYTVIYKQNKNTRQ